MTSKEIEIKKFKTVYIASDGTEFVDIDECAKYESSAECVLLSRVKRMVIKTASAWAILGGDEENECWVIKPKNTEDITNLRQLLRIYGNTSDSDELEDQIDKPVFLIFNSEKEYAWVRTLESIIKSTEVEG